MRSNVTQILKWDIIRVWRWYTHKPFGKTLVAILFTLMIGIISGSIYIYSYNVLAYLFIQEQFGLIVGDYILAMSFLISFILGVLSSAFSSVQTLFRSSRLSVLFGLPISHAKVFLAKSIETLVPSVWPVAVILLPVLAAYIVAFGVGGGKMWGAVFALILLVLLIEAIGIFLSFVVSRYLSKVPVIYSAIIVVLALFSVKPVVNFLVPQNLIKAYHASTISDFARDVYAMPIFSKIIITNWIWPSVAGYYSHGLVVVGIIVGLYLLIGVLVKHRYRELVMRTMGSAVSKFGVGEKTYPLYRLRGLQVIANDVISILRVQGYSSYVWFIAVVYSFLVSVVYRLPVLQAREQGWLGLVVGVTWFGYFSLIVLISNKFVFSLMKKEYVAPQMLLSSPLSATAVAIYKMGSAILMPLLPIAVAGYTIIDVGLYYGSSKSAAVLFGVCALAIVLIQFVFGLMNTEEEIHTEEYSTSSGVNSILSSMLSYVVVFVAIYMHIMGIKIDEKLGYIALGLIALSIVKLSEMRIANLDL